MAPQRLLLLAASLLVLLASPALSAPVEGEDLTPTPAPAPAPEDPLFGNPAEVVWFQAHGWLMWAGFGVLMPIGIITSRHLQTVTTAWFHVHIACMTLGIASICAGFGIAVNKFAAIPETPLDDPAALHVYFGLAVFILACLNFLLGVIRPHKGNLPRLFWYGGHFTFGTCAVAFGWFEIFSGMDIYEENWVIDIPSGLSDLSTLKIVFAVQISVLAFLYLFLGRWDYLLGQRDEGSPLDGVKRFTSTWHVSSMAKFTDDEQHRKMDNEEGTGGNA